MIKVAFTEEQIKELHFQRFNHPHPRVQLKMEVLYLKSQRLSHNEIANLAQVSTETVRKYIKQFNSGEIAALKKVNFRRQKSALAQHSQTIREHFAQHPAASLKQASDAMFHLTGLRRSPERVSKYLQKEGLRRMKGGMIPAKADVAAQAKFLENELEPRLEEAQKGKREVFF